MNDFDAVDEQSLESVIGAFSLSVGSLALDGGFDTGLWVTSDLGSLCAKSPLIVADTVFQTTTGARGGQLTGSAGRLTRLDQFSGFS
ncbi:MAG: hypothetical protein OEZ06_23895 [Myxococcales bacterium]|nr:hypothetical protein [Myxococcales bacterium]